MTIRIVNSPKNKPSGKFCPYMVDAFEGMEGEKKQ